MGQIVQLKITLESMEVKSFQNQFNKWFKKIKHDCPQTENETQSLIYEFISESGMSLPTIIWDLKCEKE